MLIHCYAMPTMPLVSNDGYGVTADLYNGIVKSHAVIPVNKCRHAKVQVEKVVVNPVNNCIEAACEDNLVLRLQLGYFFF